MKVGNKVQLISGSPTMTVVSILGRRIDFFHLGKLPLPLPCFGDKNIYVECVWFQENVGRFCWETFAIDCLIEV